MTPRGPYLVHTGNGGETPEEGRVCLSNLARRTIPSMGTQAEREGVREAFRKLYLADREKGEAKDLSHYKGLFPGFWDIVGDEFYLIKAEATRPAEGRDGRTVDAPPPVPVVVEALPASATPKAEVIGPYRLVKELGRGGMGVVYLAEDTRIKRRVALKILSPQFASSSHLLMRFRREAEVASRIDHPGICAVYDADVDGEVPYIAMRLVDGQTLQQWIAVSKNPTGEMPAGTAPHTVTRLPGGPPEEAPTAPPGDAKDGKDREDAARTGGLRKWDEILRVLHLV